MQSKNTGTCPISFGIFRTDGQISQKISVVVNYRYSHYKSVWTLMNHRYCHRFNHLERAILSSQSEWCLDRIVRSLVMSSWLWLRVAKMSLRQLGVEAKHPSKYDCVSLTDVLSIFLYIIQHDFAVSIFQFSRSEPSGSSGVSSIAQEVPVSLFISTTTTLTKQADMKIIHKSFPHFHGI